VLRNTMNSMSCIVCDAKMEYFFSKSYADSVYHELMEGFGDIVYYKCSHCGLTLSKTHADLSAEEWKKINYDFHHFHENNITNINQPPYIHQAAMLKVLSENHIINMKDSLDYAGGYGTLSKILKKYYHMNVPVYDPYVQDEGFVDYVDERSLSTYKTVLNSALFEHLLDRSSFDAINSLVKNDGAMVVHTVICENIPKDPDWFYLDPPVHTTFHTNKSMEILMRDWGYQACIYCLSAKSWVLLKRPVDGIEGKIKHINQELQTEYLIYKKGFVDYWKGF